MKKLLILILGIAGCNCALDIPHYELKPESKKNYFWYEEEETQEETPQKQLETQEIEIETEPGIRNEFLYEEILEFGDN